MSARVRDYAAQALDLYRAVARAVGLPGGMTGGWSRGRVSAPPAGLRARLRWHLKWRQAHLRALPGGLRMVNELHRMQRGEPRRRQAV